MKETIVNLIENESENTKLDFKLEQYPIEKGNIKKGEFLKDMCAFANLTSKEDKFIIIGAKEKNGVAVGFKPIDELHDQASYQQFLNQYIEPEINFEYNEIIHQGNRLAYFRIFNNEKRPYLFKKEYKDYDTKGNQYRTGTGFVRTGTSTRELRREDFEKIYVERLGAQDRREDIKFKVILGTFESSDLNRLGYIKHLQVDVENISNTSIDLNIEAKIYHNSHVKANCAQNLEAKMHQDARDKSMFAYTSYLNNVFPPFIPIDMNVVFQSYAAYSIFEITPQKGTHTALRVKQKGLTTDIFNGQIALIFSQPTEIKIELFVRSNAFEDGLKIVPFHFTKEDTNNILDPWDL